MKFSFQRYLSAKKTVDDRALNRLVWERLGQLIKERDSAPPIRILELGAGIATMPQRMLEWKLFEEQALISGIEYTAIDEQGENNRMALRRSPEWVKGFESFKCNFEAIDLFDFIARSEQSPKPARPAWDLLVAHAFLDLLDISISLPRILSLLKPDGIFYFTLIFDGVTILEPLIDPEFDEWVIKLYHRSMDERIISGKKSGDSQAGRHLFENLRATGMEIIEAGSSDWVVFPRQGSYPADEAYFLHFILHFFEETLQDHPELDRLRFERWLADRHIQIERGELTYVAHQLDFVGRFRN